MDAHLEAGVNTVCSTPRCDDSLTKQINVARTGHTRVEVTGCAQSVTLPSASISFPEDTNTVLCCCFCMGSSLESHCHRKMRRWSKWSIFLILNKSLLWQCKRTFYWRQIIAGCVKARSQTPLSGACIISLEQLPLKLKDNSLEQGAL